MKLALLGLAFIALQSPAHAADDLATWLGDKDFKAYHVYSADGKTSRIEEISLALKTRPGGKVAILDREVKDINLGYYDNGWFEDFHYANAKRLNIVLQGDFIFGIGDGKEYRVKAGEMYLAEDHVGKGHSSKCEAANGKRCVSMSINLGPHDGRAALPLTK